MSNHWRVNTKGKPGARCRMFCFPFAGGGASIFHQWSDALPTTVEVCPVELPGRGSRLMEPAFTEIAPLVRTMAQTLFPYLQQPFALFGHSMGALISFELVREFDREYSLKCAHLFVSAHRAPQLPNPDQSTHTLPDDALIEKLFALKGTSREVLENAELMSLMLPIVRADFAVCDTYTYSPAPALDCPISVFGGTQDPTVRWDQLDAWREQTCGPFNLWMLPGDHFFLNTARSILLKIISHELQQIIENG